MLGIHPNIIRHKLAICLQAKPISQKKRKMEEEWCKAVRKEVDKLLKAYFIKDTTSSHHKHLCSIVWTAKKQTTSCESYMKEFVASIPGDAP